MVRGPASTRLRPAGMCRGARDGRGPTNCRGGISGIHIVCSKGFFEVEGVQWFSVGCCVLSLIAFGWLDVVRSFTGNLVLIDEVLGILPGLILLSLLWLVQWPLERLVQESLLMRRLETGLPIHPIPSRWGYVLQRARMHLLLLLVPMFTIILLIESVEALAQRRLAWRVWDVLDAVCVSGASRRATFYN